MTKSVGKLLSPITAIGDITGADQAAKAATQGAQISADAQREALNYLKQTERIPQQLREGALGILGGLYDFGGVNQQDAINAVQGSEIYKQVLSSRGAGEDAILRNASATGGLRSGNVNDALARYNTELQQQAFLQGLGGLQSLAQLPSNANNIAATTANIGNTLGQGQVAAGQAQAAGRGAAFSGLLQAAPALAAFSDGRLKEDIKHIGTKNGHNIYLWSWNKKANKLGLYGTSSGVLAQEVMQTCPEAVGEQNGYLTVDYSMIGVQ